jgi:hypothetical protein
MKKRIKRAWNWSPAAFVLGVAILCLWIAAVVWSQGQNFGPGGSSITYVTTNPVTYTTGQVFYNTVTNQTLCAQSSTVLIPCGGGSFNTQIDSVNYSVVSGGRIFDAGFSNASQTVTFPNADCPTYAKAGWLVFGTQHPNTFSGIGTVDLLQGTITTGCVTGAGTLVVSSAGGSAATCVSSTSLDCEIDFGPDDTTPLLNFWNAVVNAPNCTPGVLQAGIFLVQKGQFNANGPRPGQCVSASGTAYTGPTLRGVAGFYGSVIVPTPNFDTTVGAGNSCSGGTASGALGFSGCFLGAYDINVDGLAIWGAGQPRAADGNAFAIALINGGPTQSNAYVSNLIIAAWAPSAASSFGIVTTFASQIYLYNVIVNAGGAIPCNFTVGNASAFTQVTTGTCGNGGSASNPACMKSSGNTNTFGMIIATVAAGNVHCVDITAGTWNSSQDTINPVTSAGTNYGIVMIGGTANLSQDQITDTNSTGGSTNAIFIETGTTVQMKDTVTAVARAASVAITLQAGGTLQDLCGNKVTTIVANSYSATGTLYNCPAEPSITGRCLIASAASPLACGSSSTGKVAVPISLATYTINTTAVLSGSTITVTPTTDNTGIAGAPACAAEVFGDGAVTASVAGTSFTFAQTSVATIKCYDWTIR